MLRALGLVIALELSLAGVGVATVDKDSATPLDVATATTATTLAPTGAPAGEAPSQTATTAAAAQAEKSTAKPPAATKVAASKESPGFGAPRLGSYRYRVESKTNVRSSTFSTVREDSREVKISYTRVGGGAKEVRIHRRIDGNSSYEERSYRADGSWELTTVTEKDNKKTECNWEPDKLLMQAPLREGATWAIDSRCSSANEKFEYDVHERMTMRVTGRGQQTIAGRTIDTFVVERKGTTEYTTRPREGEPQTFTSNETTTLQFAPSVGLALKQDTQMNSKNEFKNPQTGQTNSFETETTMISELLSLDPT